MPFTLPASFLICSRSNKLVKHPVFINQNLVERSQWDKKNDPHVFKYTLAEKLLKTFHTQHPNITASTRTKEVEGLSFIVEIQDFFCPDAKELALPTGLGKDGVTRKKTSSSQLEWNVHLEPAIEHLLKQFRTALVEGSEETLVPDPDHLRIMLNFADQYENSHLHWAAKHFHRNLIERLITRYNFPVDILNADKQTPLMLVADLDPKAQSEEKSDEITPDQKSITSCIQYLLSQGADIHALDRDNQTPLVHAMTVDTMKLLIQHDPTCATRRYAPFDRNAIMILIGSDASFHKDTCNYLYDYTRSVTPSWNVDEEDREGNTLLILFAKCEEYWPDDFVEKLLRDHASPLHCNKNADTALHILAKNNDQEVHLSDLEALLSALPPFPSFDFLKNFKGETPFDIAYREQDHSAINAFTKFFLRYRQQEAVLAKGMMPSLQATQNPTSATEPSPVPKKPVLSPTSSWESLPVSPVHRSSPFHFSAGSLSFPASDDDEAKSLSSRDTAKKKPEINSTDTGENRGQKRAKH